MYVVLMYEKKKYDSWKETFYEVYLYVYILFYVVNVYILQMITCFIGVVVVVEGC